MADSGGTRLALVQPSGGRREWELRRGEEVCARLRIPPVRSGASADAEGRSLRIEPSGRLSADYVVSDQATGAEVARLRREGRRRLLELDRRVAEWKRLGRRDGYGFVDPAGQVLLRAKVHSGVARTSGEVEISADLSEGERLIAALLASYVLIRKNEQTASSSVAAVVVAIT